MRYWIPAAIGGLLVNVPSDGAHAADLNLKLDIPRLNVAEYHRPYLAVWLERPDQSFAANLVVWYDIKKANNGGTKWLKDIRQWWRRSGRDLQMPADGISGATRAPGEQSLSFNAGKTALGPLPAGEYQLVVEAAREAGGREVVRVPLQWPPKTPQTLKATGEHELGAVVVELLP